MPKRGDIYSPKVKSAEFDTEIFDEDSLTWDYFAAAPRAEVLSAQASGIDPETLPIWYLRRTTKVSPYKTETASVGYDQVYADRATITTWA